MASIEELEIFVVVFNFVVGADHDVHWFCIDVITFNLGRFASYDVVDNVSVVFVVIDKARDRFKVDIRVIKFFNYFAIVSLKQIALFGLVANDVVFAFRVEVFVGDCIWSANMVVFARNGLGFVYH